MHLYSARRAAASPKVAPFACVTAVTFSASTPPLPSTAASTSAAAASQLPALTLSSTAAACALTFSARATPSYTAAALAAPRRREDTFLADGRLAAHALRAVLLAGKGGLRSSCRKRGEKRGGKAPRWRLVREAAAALSGWRAQPAGQRSRESGKSAGGKGENGGERPRVSRIARRHMPPTPRAPPGPMPHAPAFPPPSNARYELSCGPRAGEGGGGGGRRGGGARWRARRASQGAAIGAQQSFRGAGAPPRSRSSPNAYLRERDRDQGRENEELGGHGDEMAEEKKGGVNARARVLGGEGQL